MRRSLSRHTRLHDVDRARTRAQECFRRAHGIGRNPQRSRYIVSIASRKNSRDCLGATQAFHEMMKRAISSQRDHIPETSSCGARRPLTQVVRTSRLGKLNVSALLGEIIGYSSTASQRAAAAGRWIHDDERVSFHSANRGAGDRLNRSLDSTVCQTKEGGLPKPKAAPHFSWRGIVLQQQRAWQVSRLQDWCRRWDSNPRPRDYETLALPLSYTGKQSILDATVSLRKVSSRYQRRAATDGRNFIFQARNVWCQIGTARTNSTLVTLTRGTPRR
jgi:hypothetical protein